MGGSTQKKQFYNDFQKLIFGIKRVKGKKSASPLKWFVVATSLIMVLSVVYSYDTPAALKRSLYSHVKSDDFETQFAWLYSYYSLPNIVLPLIAGYLMDKFGLNTILLIFGVFAISGQLLFAYGVSEQSWWFMSAGRFFLGFGGETLKISNFALLPEWFNPIDLGLSNGIVALSRLGSLLTFLISPNLTARWSFSITLLPIIIFAFLALIALISLQYFQYRVGQQIANNEIQAYELISNPISRQSSGDREERGVSEAENDDDLEDDDDDEEEETSISEIDTILNTINDEETDDEGGKHRQTKKKGGSQNTRNRNTIMRSSNSRDQLTSPRSRSSTPTTTSSSSSSSSSTSYSSSSAFAFSNILKLELKFWLLALSYCLIIISFGPFQNLSFSILLERDTFKPIPSTCTLARTNACQSDSNPPLSSSCPQGKEYQLPLPGYYESYNPLLASDVDCSLPSWKDVCTEKYCDRYNNAEMKTSFMIIIQFFVYLFAAGPFQRVADDAMARLIWLGNAILLLFFTHLFFAVTSIPAWILMIGQGLATTLFNLTFWSLLGYTVDRKVYGTAFGILQSLQHIVYTIVPLILADVYHQSGDRYIPQVEYVFVVASVLALLPLFALYLFRNALNMQL